VQVDAAVLDALHDGGGQRVGIDLQADRERGRRVDRGADHLVHAQRVGPLRFVAERVEAEDLLALRLERGLFGGAVVVVAAATAAGEEEHGAGEARRRGDRASAMA